jgi:hypothetical protein
MSQIIMFRAKEIKTSFWRYGSLVTTLTGKAYIVFNNSEGVVMKEIYPETIGQYSGKNTKEGNYLYTGDILSFGNTTFAEITFENGCFSVFGEPLGWNFDVLDENSRPEIYDLEQCTRIGNIHDNPEIELWKPNS